MTKIVLRVLTFTVKKKRLASRSYPHLVPIYLGYFLSIPFWLSYC